MPTTTRDPRARSDFLRRFGYYLIGVAIGCVLVGMLMNSRARAAANREEARRIQAEQAAASQSSPAPTPPPAPSPAPAQP